MEAKNTREIKRERKSNMEYAKQLMIINGQDYDEWLDIKHKEYRRSNEDIINKLLEEKAKQVELQGKIEVNQGNNQYQADEGVND